VVILRPMFLRAFLIAAFLASPLSAAEIQVYAAASLSDVVKEIAQAYERSSRDRIVFNFGASSSLARQIANGAPADVFLSADEEKMNVLHVQKLIVPATRISLLSNTLAVVVAKTDGAAIHSARDLATVRRLALADPRSVPAGIYAREYLENAGVWTAVAPNVVVVDNVRAALTAVEVGAADAAIVYRTDALISKKTRVAYDVPRAEGPDISYAFALVTAAEHPEGARRFLKYLSSPAALAVFTRHGFLIRER
jgi:molybdate transport system substrate-binding protein